MGNLYCYGAQDLGGVRTNVHSPKKAAGTESIWLKGEVAFGRVGRVELADAYGNLVVPSRAPNAEHAALGSSALSCFTVLFLSYVTILLFGMGALLCTILCWKYATCFWLLQGSQLRDCLSLRTDYALYFCWKLLKSMETTGKGMDASCIVR